MARYGLILILSCIIFGFVLVLNANHIRHQRFFGDDIETVVKVKTAVVTSIVPSSCIKISPTLQPCRNMRSLVRNKRFLSSYMDSFFSLEDPTTPPPYNNVIQRDHEKDNEDLATVNSQSWGEYLGLVSPTTTITSTYYFTTTVVDPRTTLVFKVQGCRPSNLPLNLQLCHEETKTDALILSKSRNTTQVQDYNTNIIGTEISPTEATDESLVHETKSVYDN